MVRHPDLDEQRRDLPEYNIHAKNNAGEGLLHVVVKRSCNIGEIRDTKDLFRLWELGLVLEEERTPERRKGGIETAEKGKNAMIIDQECCVVVLIPHSNRPSFLP